MNENEVEIETKPEASSGMDLIPTTELLRHMNVVYDEVLDTKPQVEAQPEEFIITPIVNKAEAIEIAQPEP